MTLSGPGGEISLGSFTPSFTPGRPLAIEEGSTVLGAAVLGADTGVLVKRASSLAFVVFGAGEPRVVEVTGGPSTADRAWVRETNGAIEALVEDGGAPVLITFDGTDASAAPYAALDGSYLGAGVDDAGFVIVVHAGGGIVRYRGAPDAPEADGPGVSLPTTGSNAKLAVSGDGTVVRAWSSDAGNALDDMVRFNMAGLGPREHAFGSGVSLGSLDDVFKSLEMSVTSGVVTISFCATDSGVLAKTETPCGTSATVDGRAKLSIANAQALAYAAGRVTAASCHNGGIVLGGGSPATELALDTTTTALYPCGGPGGEVQALVTDPGGTRLVVTREGKLYVARRR
jgi:hypothetical protein